jgi:hypothetical protein
MKTITRFVAVLGLTWAGWAGAVPIAYNYDDTGAVQENPGAAGTGMFTFDLPSDTLSGSFVVFNATGVMDDGIGLVEPWAFVTLFVASDVLFLSIFDGVALSFVRAAQASTYGLASFTDAASAWALVVDNPLQGFEGVSISPKGVPLPSTLALFALGLAGLRVGSRRHRV